MTEPLFPSNPEEYEQYQEFLANGGNAVFPTDESEPDDEDEDFDDEHDPFLTDAEADADALASAGWGTDEDYGGYGDDGW